MFLTLSDEEAMVTFLYEAWTSTVDYYNVVAFGVAEVVVVAAAKPRKDAKKVNHNCYTYCYIYKNHYYNIF